MQNHDTTAPNTRTHLDKIDKIDAHARQAWALSELLIDHFGGQEDHNVLNDDIMCSLMENMSYHLEAIRRVTGAAPPDPSKT
ncbi:hypothetical protein [Halomonas urumqiensis]|uniref:Uncharacterized protein n=1 Tax=Halomonas urumqiensis TaxID=1684789 RepID=A0A2N7UF62_9GAMM|nr:hypothetical protein [Halomonas urumqiensis]PMR79108.1 hypothetical protein C1H70_12430 [Halomonas urumqiensis]PTB03782.1 hypothetical protein C6V82_04715 [Halomonas urumqiensis]GHE19988.1 hypothetical protein GCM10017767_05090 [Halomonas urumqiensis]